MTYIAVFNDDYLEHHGVKGMKWGIRRKRNGDYKGWRDKKNWHKPTKQSAGKAAHNLAHPYKSNPYYAAKARKRNAKRVSESKDAVKQYEQWFRDNPNADARATAAVQEALSYHQKRIQKYSKR